jgi:hypothetical protein
MRKANITQDEIVRANYIYSPTTCLSCEGLVLHLAKCEVVVLQLEINVKI